MCRIITALFRASEEHTLYTNAVEKRARMKGF